MPPILIVHGGAGELAADLGPSLREGCEQAAAAGWRVLADGGAALDAVETAVRALEDDARFNAGRGACLTRDGTIEVDAAVMTGDDLRLGAVAAVPNLKNPITLARRVLERDEHALLCGAGALAFARECGIEPNDPRELVTPKALARFHELWSAERRGGDTVGAVAIDREGRVAAASSTGGVACKRSGRIGDSPIAGAGLYADARLGGATATGHGEAILRAGLSRDALERLARGADPMRAAREAVARMQERTGGGRGGLILLSPDGRPGLAHNTAGMSWAVAAGSTLRGGWVASSPAREVGGARGLIEIAPDCDEPLDDSGDQR